MTDPVIFPKTASPSGIAASSIRILIDVPIGGEPHLIAQYIATAFRQLGYRVECLDNSMAREIFEKIREISPGNTADLMASKLISLLTEFYWDTYQKFQPHLAFFLSQSPVNAQFLKSLRARNDMVTAFWFLENSRLSHYWQEHAPFYEYFFGIQKGPFSKELQAIGSANPGYLPMAADESVFRTIALSENERHDLGSDLAYLGPCAPNRLALFGHLRDYDFKIWGQGWEKQPWLAARIQFHDQPAQIEDTVKIYNAAKIHINLHPFSGSGYFDPHNDLVNRQTFEIMACGAFQLVDRRTLLPELFVEDDEIVCFSSVEELRRKIDYYLAHDSERIRIAQNGQKKVLQQHTYRHRIAALMEKIQKSSFKFTRLITSGKESFENIWQYIGDPELENFLQTIPPDKRSSLPFLAAEVQKNSGPFKNYEVILLLLETFLDK
jgi:spore maturation protein CgeB